MITALGVDHSDTLIFPIQLLIVAGWLGLVALVAESIRRFLQADAEVIRKVVHIGTGNVILLAWGFHLPAWLGVVASSAFSLITLLSYWFPILPEINNVGRQSLGTFFYSLSIGVLIAWFWPLGLPYYAVLGILIMAWGDGLAALIGQRWGHHRYELWGMKKSWEGSLTMLLTTILISMTILGMVYGMSGGIAIAALAIAIVSTALEAFSKLGIDNLTVPLGSAAIAYGLTLHFL